MKHDHHTQLLIIGAGPYGLSLAAYAQKRGMEFTIVGEPMGFWEKNMPEGMLLRSGRGWHLDPFDQFTFTEYIKANNIVLDPSEPITREHFLAYSKWFMEQYGIDVVNIHVNELRHDRQRFVASFDGGQIIADNVVVAVGPGYFAHVPPMNLDMVPKDLYSHTCNTNEFEFLKGKTCTVVGGRQSAFEWAALIAESGAEQVNIVYEHDTPDFTASNWDFVDDDIDEFRKDPKWFGALGADEQKKVNNRFWEEGRLKLEPWLKERLEKDNIRFFSNRHLAEIRFDGDKVSVITKENDVLVSDHVLFATGYKVDISRIPFIANGNLQQQIQTRNSFPVLDHHFQSSVPGLFFTSIASTQEHGPYFGFVKGAATTAVTIGKYLNT